MVAYSQNGHVQVTSPFSFSYISDNISKLNKMQTQLQWSTNSKSYAREDSETLPILLTASDFEGHFSRLQLL